MPPGRTWLIFLAILLTNFFLVRMILPSPDAPSVPYTLFRAEVEHGNVEAIFSRGESINGRFRSPVTYSPDGDTLAAADAEPVTDFSTTLPAFVDPGLEALLIANDVEIRAEPLQEGFNPLLMLLFGFGPALLLIGL